MLSYSGSHGLESPGEKSFASRSVVSGKGNRARERYRRHIGVASPEDAPILLKSYLRAGSDECLLSVLPLDSEVTCKVLGRVGLRGGIPFAI